MKLDCFKQMFSIPSSMLLSTRTSHSLITFRGKEKPEVYSKPKCIQNRGVAMEFGNRMYAFQYRAICRVLGTPMVGLGSLRVLRHQMERTVTSLIHGGWPAILRECLSFFSFLNCSHESSENMSSQSGSWYYIMFSA